MNNKPKFDPSKPFTAADSGKPKFDPSKPFEAADDPAEKAPSKIEAGLQGWGQGTLGRYLPEVQAATYSPMEKILDLVGGGEIAKGEKALAAQGIKDKEDTYSQRLKENRARDKELQKSGAYTAAEIGGNVFSTALPAGALAKTARGAKLLKSAPTALGKIGQASAAGAGQGFITNPEEGSRLENAVYGGLAGLGGQSLISGFSKAGKGAKKVLAASTGIGEKPLDTYLSRGSAVEDLIGKYGDDIQSASRDAREGFIDKITSKKGELQNVVKSALKPVAGNPQELAEASALVSKVKGLKSGINRKTNPEGYSDLKELIKPLRAVTKDGNITMTDLNDLKSAYQGMAKGAYKQQGKFAGKGDDFANQAKVLGAEARNLLNAKKPAIKEANEKLSRLYELDTAKGNLLNPDAEASQLIQAGSRSGKDRQILGEIGDLAGGDFVKTAEDLAAMKAFANPNPLSAYNTGRSLLGASLGGAAGSAGGDIGQGGEYALYGAALSNPVILKKLIQAGQATKAIPAYSAAARGAEAVNPYITGIAAERLREMLNR